MSTIVLHRSGKRQFVGTDERHQTLVMDAGPRGGGDHAGLKPSELLPFSLGACIAVTLVNILEKQRQGPFELEIEVSFAQKADPPWQFTRFSLHYRFEGHNLDETKIRSAIKLAEERYCSVTASLKDEIRIETTVSINAPAVQHAVG